MKFTKDDACKELAKTLSEKKLVEKIDKWERTIRENVETLFSLMGEDFDIELDAFIERAVPLFNTTAGFIRKENADLAKSYEDKIKEISQQKEEKKEDKTEIDLANRLKALEDELAAEKAKAAVSEKKKEFLAKAKESGIENDEWLRAVLEKTSFSENTDIESEVQSFVEIYNKFNSSIPPTPTPKNPKGGSSEAVNEIIKEAAEIAKQNIY